MISLTRFIVVPTLALWHDVTNPGSPSVRKMTVTGALRGAPRPGHAAQRTAAEEEMGFEVRKGNRGAEISNVYDKRTFVGCHLHTVAGA